MVDEYSIMGLLTIAALGFVGLVAMCILDSGKMDGPTMASLPINCVTKVQTK